MQPTFRDLFSGTSAGYAQFRPRYPRALFEWIASESPALISAWDCGTGNGQAATALAECFTTVVATDASAAQLAAAVRHPGVHYVRCSAEAPALASASVDCVTVAQAVHWFDMPAFFREAARVARPGALLAVWTYGNMSIDRAIDRVVESFYTDTVGPYWPPERKHIEQDYRGIPMPFERVTAPVFPLETPMTLDAVAGYIGTWSAVHLCREATGIDPMPAVTDALRDAWGDPLAARTARWPITMLAGRL